MLALFGLPSLAHAQDQDRYWDANSTGTGSGGNGNWNTTDPVWSESNSDVLGPYRIWNNAALDNAIFGVTAGGTTTTVGTVTLTEPITVHNMTFQRVNGWVLSGGTLTLAGTTPTINTLANTTINSVIAGTNGLTKTGSSQLFLTGANTFSGGITLSGSLRAANDAALGHASNNITTIANASFTLDTGTTARTITIGGGTTLAISGAGAGSALYTGTGNISVVSGVTLSNDANTYTGTTRLNGVNQGSGIVNFTSVRNLGEASSLGAPTTVADGTITFAGGSQYSDNIAYVGDGDTSNRNWVLQGGPARVFRQRGTGTLTLTGDISVTPTSFLAETADFELLGVISGTGNVGFGASAAGSITLGGANTFTGNAGVSGGIVRAPVLADAGFASSLGTASTISLGNLGRLTYTGAGNSSNRAWSSDGATSILNDGTGALNLGGDLAFVAGGTDTLTLGGSFAGASNFTGIISGSGNLASGGNGTWILTGVNSRTGTLSVNGGTLRAGSASAFGTVTGVSVNAGTLDLNGFDLTTPTLAGTGGTLSLGNAFLTLNTSVANSFAGSITGTGGLNKLGAGALTLTGASTYSGDTNIQGGTLTLNFAPAGGPASDIVNASSTLNMSGGTLNITGAAGEVNTQTFDGLNITTGANTITGISGSGGSLTVNFGAISRTGGIVNFNLPTNGNFTTTNSSLGGWATVNGTDYAKVVGGNILAFTDADYTDKDDASTWANGEFISDSDGDADSYFGTVGSSIQLGGLQFTTPDATTTVTIADGQTLGVDGTIIIAPSVLANNQTITGGNLTGLSGSGGVLGVLHNGTGTLTIASTIVDNGGATGFTKGGQGTVSLTGANTYTGATTLSNGRLVVNSIGDGGAASAIGASSAAPASLVLQGGILQYTGGSTTTDRGFTLINGGADTPTIQVDGAANLTFTGQVTSPDDEGLVKTGGGTLTLANAANDYVGVTRIENGILSVGTLADGGQASGIGAATSDSTNLVLLNGGTLQYTGGSVDIDRGLTIENGAGRIDVSSIATELTVGGTIVGAGRLEKYGDGTLVLTGTSTYTGITVVNAGTLRAGAALAGGSTAGVFGIISSAMTVNAGATLDLADNSNQIGALNGGGNVTLGALPGTTLTIGGANSGSPGFTGTISGAGNVTHTNGTQVMTGCGNSYEGITTITGAFGGSVLSTDCIRNGGVNSGIGASDSAPGSLVLQNSGILNYTAVGTNQTTDRGFTLGAGFGYIQVNDPGTTLEFTGAIVGPGSLIKRGAGTLILSGVNSSTGETRVEAGILRAGSATAFGTGSVVLSNVAGAVLDLNGYNMTASVLSGGGAAGGNVQLGSGTLTVSGANGAYAGLITGTGGLVKTGGGTQYLSGCSSNYTGGTSVTGGILQVQCLTNGGTNSSIGASSSAASNLVVNNGALTYLGTGSSTDRLMTIGGTAQILSSGTGGVNFTNTGAVVFANPNTAQSIRLGGTYAGDNRFGLRLDNNGAGVTSLIKQDAGTWILTNSGSTYTGTTQILGGVLGVDKLSNGGLGSSLGASSNAATNLIIGSGATLRYTGAGDSTDRRFTLAVGTTFIESSGTGAVNFTNNGAVSYTGSGTRVMALGGTNAGDNIMGATIASQGANVTSLAKNDSGRWILTGTNTYTGLTNINAGTLVIGNGGTAGSVASSTINNAGVLGFNRSDTLTIGGNIQGTGAVQQIGAGTTLLTGASTYTGGTTVADGTLQIGNGGTTGSIVGNVATAGDGVLAFNRNDAVTFAGSISGTGSVRQTGGVLALTSANSYSGGTTINGGGTLQITSDANLGDTAGAITFDNGTLQVRAPVVSNRNVVLAGNGTIDVNTTLDSSTSWTAGGTITGPGALTKIGLGRLILTGDATHTGQTTITQGVLQIGNGGTSGSIAGDIFANGGTSLLFNRSDSYAYDGSLSGAGSVAVDAGILSITGNSNFGGNVTVQPDAELRVNGGNGVTTTGLVTAQGGTLAVSGAGSVLETGRVSSVVTDADGARINITDGGVIRTTGPIAMQLRTLSGTGSADLSISGAGSLVDLGSGQVQIATTTASTSVVTIANGGALRTDGLVAIGAVAGNTTPSTVTITGAGSSWTGNSTFLQRNGQFSVLGGGTASFGSAQIGTIAQGASTLVSGAGSTFTTTGLLSVGTTTGSGVLTVVGGGRVIAGSGLSLAEDAGTTGVLNIGAAAGDPAAAAGFVDGVIVFGPGAGTLNFNHSEADYAFGSAISGTGSINQLAGFTRLTGNSVGFAGTTSVSGGTLLVEGTLGDAASVLSVASGATLGGTGTIGGSVTIADGGVLAPGSNGVGALTINGNLALGNASQLNFEFGQANMPGGPLNDIVNVGGDLTLDGVLNVTQTAEGNFGPGVYRMFNYAGALTDNGLLIGTMPSGSDAFVQTAIAGQVNLANTAGLTLNFWDGAGQPKNDGAIQGSDGIWRVGGGEINWTEVNGTVNADYAQDSFAIFQGTSGIVTVDNGNGNVLSAGMQFAASGYTIAGGLLTLTGADALIRTGINDPTDAGIVATITADLTGTARLVKDLAGTLVLSGTNSYTGGTVINGGTLSISADANLGDAAGGLSLNGGTLNTTASFSSARAVDLANAGTFLTDGGTVLTLGGLVSGGGALTKTGAGSLVLTADNGYTGGTTIAAGTLQLGNGGTGGAILGDVANDGLLAFNRSDSLAFAGAISGNGVVSQIGSGATILTADSSYTGGTTIAAGTLQLGNGGTTGGITGDVVNDAALVFNRSNVYSFSGLISGSGDVRQEAGTTILTADNSYIGSTVVSSGTLLINGNQSAANGTTNVLGGGGLGGTGTIGGDVTVADGATLAPGDATGPGTLTINGNLGFNANAVLGYDFGRSNVVGGPLNDLVNVGGNLTLDGTLNVTASSGGSFDPGLYRVISYNGTLTNNGLVIGTIPSGTDFYVQTSVANQVNLINTDGLALRFWDGAAGVRNDGIITGGDGLWQNVSGNDNWTLDDASINAPFLDSAFAVFGGMGGTVEVDNDLGAVRVSGMQFASAGYRVTEQDLSLVGPQSIIRVGDGTSDGLGYTATIENALVGNSQLVKRDLGTLVLMGINSYTGGTRIDVGTLRISDDANLGAAAGDLSFDGGRLHTTANINSARNVDLLGTGTFLTDAGTSLILTGAITGSGNLIKDGAGTLALNDTSNHSGTTSVLAGSLFINGDQSAALGLTSVASGSTLGGSGIIGGDVVVAAGGRLAPGNSPGTLTINGGLALDAASILDFEFGQANVAGGALNDLVNVGGDLTLDGTINVTVSTGGTFGPGVYRVFNYGGTLTNNGLSLGAMPGGSQVSVQTAIAGQVNLVNTAGLTLRFWDGDAGPKNNAVIDGGNGVWRLNDGSSNWADASGNVNADYTQDSFAVFTGMPGTVTLDNAGGTVLASGMQFAGNGYTITGDVLTLTGAQAIVQVGDSSVAGAGYTATIDAALAGTAALVKTDAGTLVLTGANSFTGGTVVSGGTLRISSDSNLGDAAGSLSLSDGTLNTAADLLSARAVGLGGNGTLLTDDATTLTLAGTVNGAGSLTKEGTGTLVLSGIGTHTGAINVGTGTLLVNGDYAGATGATTVAAGASLGGTGTIGGNVALADGAMLTPGAGGAGTLTINGGLSLSSGSRLAFEFGQANTAGGALNDLVNVSGDLVLDGTIDVTVPAGRAFDVGVYRVFNYGGTLTDGGLAVGTLPGSASASVQTSIVGQVNLVNTGGLTLGFWDGAAGPKNNNVVNGGSGTWQNGSGNDNWTDANGKVNAAFSDDTFAVFGGMAGTVTVDDSLGDVTASGMQFASNGYAITGGPVGLTGPQSIIRVGDGSTAGGGFTAEINSALTGNTQLVKTDAGTLVLGGVNSYTGGTAINGGTVQIAADANLGAASGGVTLDGGTLATSANVTSARGIVMASAGTISTAGGTTFTYGGAVSGSGVLTKAGAGTLLVTGDNSGFAGTTTVATGTLAVTGSLGGALEVNSAGRLEGTGTVGNVTNAGIVAPGSDGFGTLTVKGSYTGSAGTLEIEAALGGDSSQADRLVIANGTSGTTAINVINRGGLGAQTVEGIKIVDVTGGSSAGTFTLNGDYVFEGEQAVVAGAFGYRLYQGGIASPTDGDWYLRSALLNPASEPVGPLYQPGVPLYESYAATLQTLNRLGTLQERVGNRQWSGFTQGGVGMWGRMEGTRYRPEAVFSTSGSDLDVNDWSLQAGFDKALVDNAEDTIITGVNARYGKADASVRSRFGNGSIDTRGYGVGATLTWYESTGFYADAQAQVSWYRSDLKSGVLGMLIDNNHGSGEAFSFEAGKRAPLGGGLSVTPQIQMTYSKVRFDRFEDPNGAAVSSDRADSLKTRWGISLDHQKSWDGSNGSRSSHLYGIVNLTYEWLDGSVTGVSGTPIARRDNRLWGEVGLGGSYSWAGGKLTLFSELSANTAIHNFGDSNSLKGNAGFRMRF